jgi:N6-L-threonylcarbamoyladenine synthase
MRILAIETSCDETAVAVLTGEGENLTLESSFVRSQIDIHAEYGGVVPEVAAREHLEMIFPMLKKAASTDGRGIDAIAVTAGPGLAPALRVGVETAKALAMLWNKPLVPVCHLEGHIYAAWLSKKDDEKRLTPQFPALALIVSGGHTELVYMKDHGVFERLGETIDDAAGEAFDKVAKMLGLGYPGGPKVAKLAEEGDITAFDFPRAMLKDGTLNFSFSGLKTSVLYTLRKEETRMADSKFRSDIAASFEEAVVDVLTKKTRQAINLLQGSGVNSIILAGGVAANIALRDRLTKLSKEVNIPLFLPPFEYSLDNAAMIAAAGYFRATAKHFTDPLTLRIDPNMDIV